VGIAVKFSTGNLMAMDGTSKLLSITELSELTGFSVIALR